MSGPVRVRLAAATLVLIVLFSVLIHRTAAAVPGASHPTPSDLSDLSLPSQEPALVSREVLVRFKDEVTVCAEALFASRQPFRSATADRSPSLDLLFKQLRIQDVRPVFRPACSAPAPIAELRRQELSAPQREGRPGAAPGPELYHVYRLALGPGVDPVEAAAALRSDPHLAFFSSLALGITIVGFNLLGDGLRDLLDPRIRER